MINEATRHRDVTQDRTAVHQEALAIIPAGAGPRVATPKGGVAYSIRPPGSQDIRPGAHLAVIMLAPCRGMQAALGGNRRLHFDAPTGMIVVNPAGWEGTMSWRSRREEIVVAISEESLSELAQDVDADSVELQPPSFGTVDREALRIAQMIKAELQQGFPADLYVDSLITLFGFHLVRRHSNVRRAMDKVKGGLSEKNSTSVLEFMMQNFSRKISIAELAALCHLSNSHFLHSFTKSFGQPPHKILINMRLDFATKLLLESTHSLSEIALRSGFASQSHLTAIMKGHRNITPGQIRLRK